jgi:hypothetical protein
MGQHRGHRVFIRSEMLVSRGAFRKELRKKRWEREEKCGPQAEGKVGNGLGMRI